MSRVRNPLLLALIGLRGNARAATYTEPMWGLSMMLVLPYASVYMLALGLHDEQIGLLATVAMLSQMVFGLLGGVITDKYGRRWTTALWDVVAWSIPCLIWAFAQNFWFFLVASLVNGAWQVTQNSWDCLLVEDVRPDQLTKVYSLVKVAGDLSALFAPIAAALVAQFGLVPAVRILYINAFVVMTAKVFILFHWSTETETGWKRMEQTRNQSLWSLVAGYRQVIGIALRSRGTVFSLAIMAIVAAAQLVEGTFWQIIASQKLLVSDPLLPFFPMLRSVLSIIFFFTVIPRLTGAHHLKRPTLLGFAVWLVGQVILVAIPAPAGAAGWETFALLGTSLAFDGFGIAILGMLAESLVALSVDRDERSRVMALQRTFVMLVTAPFGWIAGWLSGMDRTFPFLLTGALLALGLVVTGRFYVTTHTDPVTSGVSS